jgi:cell division protein FtsZ
MTLEEINVIGETISKKMNPEATVMWGARVLPEFNGKLQVITIITGVKSPYIMGRPQEARRAMSVAENFSKEFGIRVYA